MASANDQRKIKNLVREPGKQYRHALYYFGFTVAGALLVNTFFLASLQRYVAHALLASGVDAATVAAAIEGPVREFVWRAMLLFPLLGLISIFFALRMTHRFLGPQVAIQRHLDALIAGDYTSTCRIRRKDELQGVAAKLNELSAALAERHGQEARDTAAA